MSEDSGRDEADIGENQDKELVGDLSCQEDSKKSNRRESKRKLYQLKTALGEQDQNG